MRIRIRDPESFWSGIRDLEIGWKKFGSATLINKRIVPWYNCIPDGSIRFQARVQVFLNRNQLKFEIESVLVRFLGWIFFQRSHDICLSTVMKIPHYKNLHTYCFLWSFEVWIRHSAGTLAVVIFEILIANYYRQRVFACALRSSVSDPDLTWIRIRLGQRIRIQICQIFAKKRKKWKESKFE